MLRLIYRQILYEPFRVLLTCAALGSALALILLLEGFQTGLLSQLKNVSLSRGADLIVAQSGVSNFVASRSLLPQISREVVESIKGVKETHPITSMPVIYQKPGYRKSPIFFMVYDTGGGPEIVIEGTAAIKPRDIVIDKSLAVLYDLNVGDPFIVADFKFNISGITQNSSALFTAFAFIKYDDMIDFFFDSDLVGDISNLPLLSFLLVNIDDNADPSVVAASIENKEPEADVFFPQELSENDIELGRTLFGPVMGVLISAGYIIALLVVGIIMFATVHARLRNFGVIKALGFSNYYLITGIAYESLIMIIISFPFALLISQFGSLLIEGYVPLYMVPVLEPVVLLRTFLSALLLGVIGAYLPFRLITKLDPAIVFRV
ncbi:MAG: ABC transporter permease [Gammaproteobacteria bacterium]|nr:ABC transporter permease [Gammaproteobacteria bacterium]